MFSDIGLQANTPIARTDDYFKTQFDKLEFVLAWCKKEEAILLQAGDWHESPRGYYVLERETELLREYNVPIYCVYGNHDQYLRNDGVPTNLSQLVKNGLVTILGGPPIKVLPLVDDYNICLYGVSYNQNLPEIETSGDFNILVIHADIANEAAYPGHEYSGAKTFLRLHKEFDIILCGHIHRYFIVESKDGRVILNSGPMLREDATKYNFDHKPQFIVYDTEKQNFDWVEIPHAPAEEVLSREHLETQKQVDNMMSEFVAGMETEFEAGTDFFENLQLFIQENDISDEVQSKMNKIMGKE